MYRIRKPQRQRNFKAIYKNIEAVGEDGTYQVKNGKIINVKGESLSKRELGATTFNKIISLKEAERELGLYVYYDNLDMALAQKALWVKEVYDEINEEIEQIRKISEKTLKNCNDFLENYPEIMF